MGSVTQDLERFVRDALAAGASRQEIEAVLANAGWTPDQSRAALAAYEGAAHEAVVATPAGSWRIDTADTTSEPGDAVVVDANGQRWKPAGGDVMLSVDLIAVFDEALGSLPPTTLPPPGVRRPALPNPASQAARAIISLSCG